MNREIISHKDQEEFIKALNLESPLAGKGIFIFDIQDFDKEVSPDLNSYRNEFYEIDLIKDQYDFMFSIDDIVYRPKGAPYVCFVAPGQVQTFEVTGDDPTSSGFVLYVDKDALKSLSFECELPFFRRDGKNYFELETDHCKALFGLLQEMKSAFASPSKHSQEILKAYISIFLLRCLDYFYPVHRVDATHPQQIVARFESLVNMQYTRHKSVQYYANELSISARQLNNHTQQVLGKSPLKVIHDIVLNEAKALLSNAISSSEVAYTLGFEEAGHFSRFFKKLTGRAPSEYKRNFQN